MHDGSTHVVLEPLDFIASLAALVPRPRLNLTRFHGVLAPNFKHRKRIVTHGPRGRVDSDKPRAPMSWAQRLKRVSMSYKSGTNGVWECRESRHAKFRFGRFEKLILLSITR